MSLRSVTLQISLNPLLDEWASTSIGGTHDFVSFCEVYLFHLQVLLLGNATTKIEVSTVTTQNRMIVSGIWAHQTYSVPQYLLLLILEELSYSYSIDQMSKGIQTLWTYLVLNTSNFTDRQTEILKHFVHIPSDEDTDNRIRADLVSHSMSTLGRLLSDTDKRFKINGA